MIFSYDKVVEIIGKKGIIIIIGNSAHEKLTESLYLTNIVIQISFRKFKNRNISRSGYRAEIIISALKNILASDDVPPFQSGYYLATTFLFHFNLNFTTYHEDNAVTYVTVADDFNAFFIRFFVDVKLN